MIMFDELKKTGKKATRLLDQAQYTLKRTNNIALKEVVPTLSATRSLISDFSKTSGQLRELIGDIGSQTSDVMVHLDNTINGFDEVIREVDSMVSHLTVQTAAIDISRINQDLNKISGRALDLIESSVNIASTIKNELPQLSFNINHLFKKVFNGCKIIIDKSTKNLDRLQEFLNNIDVIAQNAGDKSVELMDAARLVFRNTDLEVKRASYTSQQFFSEATKATNKVHLLTDTLHKKIDASNEHVAETVGNVASISRMINNGMQGAILFGILGFVYQYLSREDNLKSPPVFSTTEFFVFGFCVFGMMTILKSSSLLAPRGRSPLFQDSQSLLNIASAEKTKELTSRDDKSSKSSLEADQEELGAVFKDFVSNP